MANRTPNRYALPEKLGKGRQLSCWIMGMPFFLGSAIKHSYRGWNDLEDMEKAVEDAKLAVAEIITESLFNPRLKINTDEMQHDLFELDGNYLPIEQINAYKKLLQHGSGVSTNSISKFFEELVKRKEELKHESI